MDALLERVGHQALNLALRSGITLTSGFAIQQCTRLLKSVDDKKTYKELAALQKLLHSKIQIISPAIDLIELKSGRGNVFLEGAAPLAKSLHQEIVALGKRLEITATTEELLSQNGSSGRAAAEQGDLAVIMAEIKELLARIDRDIPLIQLAITASGESFSTTLPSGVSPSRLMQASAFLSFGDMQFAADSTRPVQIGPAFTVSIYMLFVAHDPRAETAADMGEHRDPTPSPRSSLTFATANQAPSDTESAHGDGGRKPIWQEVMHKARVRLCRTPPRWIFDPVQGYCAEPTLHNEPGSGRLRAEERADPIFYTYHLELIEDLNDGRLHGDDAEAQPGYDDIEKAGIRESLPIQEISKIFYTDTGRILNIGSAGNAENNPVLLLKRAVNAPSSCGDANQDQNDNFLAEKATGVERDDQDDIDRQLREESEVPWEPADARHVNPQWSLPAHLDPEWFALEVFVEDADDSSSEDTDGDEDDTNSEAEQSHVIVGRSAPKNRSSVDSKLLAQIRDISLRHVPSSNYMSKEAVADVEKVVGESADTFVARSPFGAVTTSLSLLEMLIRLTSLQEFQQISHLSIPDHITTFFLEETSTTGLTGEAHWRERTAAKQKVGFDPYSDTPGN